MCVSSLVFMMNFIFCVFIDIIIIIIISCICKFTLSIWWLSQEIKGQQVSSNLRHSYG